MSVAAGTVLAASAAAAAYSAAPAIMFAPGGSGGTSLSAPADIARASAHASSARGDARAGGSRPDPLARVVVEVGAAAGRRVVAAYRAVAAEAHADGLQASRRQAAQRQAARRHAASGPAAPSGTPQQIAMAMLPGHGWSSGQFSCLDNLWTRESGWNVYATNPTSGAYGIPQALPGSKMASAGADWQTNPATQIRWGLGYIQATYGSPCGAWAHETAYGWY